MSFNTLVVVGVGGMGQSIARRQGAGKKVLLSDFDESILSTAAEALRGEGYDVVAFRVDVTSRASVADLAGRAADLGKVTEVVHTAGLSPVQAPLDAILAVDLLGVALTLEEFGRVVARGGPVSSCPAWPAIWPLPSMPSRSAPSPTLPPTNCSICRSSPR